MFLLKLCLYHKSNLTSSDCFSTDLISSELSTVIGRSHKNWVTSWRMTKFAVSATNHNADELRSGETRSGGVRLDL